MKWGINGRNIIWMYYDSILIYSTVVILWNKYSLLCWSVRRHEWRWLVTKMN
jgi:hypothetical protein